jgi:hypothetical protein
MVDEDNEDWYKFDDDRVSDFPVEKLATLDGGGKCVCFFVVLMLLMMIDDDDFDPQVKILLRMCCFIRASHWRKSGNAVGWQQEVVVTVDFLLLPIAINVYTCVKHITDQSTTDSLCRYC